MLLREVLFQQDDAFLPAGRNQSQILDLKYGIAALSLVARNDDQGLFCNSKLIMLAISDISIDKLKNGKLKKELPEIYELREVIENNDWHNNQSVFDHTILVLEKLKELLKRTNNKISFYLNQKINNHTRKELLFLGALFHDIGKKETLVENNNLTWCYGHEETGFNKVKTILNRFDLSENEKEIIAKIIKHHSEIHFILESGNKKLEEQYNEFKANREDIFLELILLGMADILGSQLDENKPNEFKFGIDFYNKVIDNF